MSLLSRDTGVDRWMSSSVSIVGSGVGSEQVERCLSVLEERHSLLMFLYLTPTNMPGVCCQGDDSVFCCTVYDRS